MNSKKRRGSHKTLALSGFQVNGIAMLFVYGNRMTVKDADCQYSHTFAKTGLYPSSELVCPLWDFCGSGCPIRPLLARLTLLTPPSGQTRGYRGSRLHINCTGTGSPTVILDAGLGGTSLDWSKVQPVVARFTRVCSYCQGRRTHEPIWNWPPWLNEL